MFRWSASGRPPRRRGGPVATGWAKRFLARSFPLFLALLGSMTALARAGNVVPVAGPQDGALTLRTVWRWESGADPDGTYLAALTDTPEAGTPRAAVVWRQDRSGWFPAWRLELQVADAGGTVVRAERLWQGSIAAGAVYTVLLSADPEAGIVAAAVYDGDQPEPLATGGVPADLGAGPWYAAAGHDARAGGPYLVEAEVHAGFRPVDVRFQAGERTTAGTLLPLLGFSRTGTAAVRIQHDVVPPGSYRLSVRPAAASPGGGTVLFDDVTPAAVVWLDLPLERLPLGPVDLVLEYLEDGRTVYALSRTVTIGAVTLHFTDYRVDPSLGTVTVQVRAEADPGLEDVRVTVRGRFARTVWSPERQAQVETAWPEEVVAYTGSLGALLSGGPHALTLPLPRPDGTWRLDLQVEAEPAVQVNATRAREDLAVGGYSYWVAVTDQASQRILVLDPNVPDWNDPSALKWSWHPNAANGFAAYTPGWGLPSGVKLRRSAVWGGEWMVVVDSRGLAAIVPYPAGDERKWSLVIDGNLHSAELLPDGNIALAASTGGWVRVYTSSQGPDARRYAEFALPGAHGVLWDPSLEVLWAVGDHALVALRVGGTPAAPVLEKVRETPLPTPWGHDLAPVYGDPDRLWVTTNTRVYQYVKSTGTWVTGFFGGDALNLSYVKGVGNDPSGRVVLTQQKAGTLYSWTTDTVMLLFPYEERTRDGAAFYKVRVWNPDYQ